MPVIDEVEVSDVEKALLVNERKQAILQVLPLIVAAENLVHQLTQGRIEFREVLAFYAVENVVAESEMKQSDERKELDAFQSELALLLQEALVRDTTANELLIEVNDSRNELSMN